MQTIYKWLNITNFWQAITKAQIISRSKLKCYIKNTKYMRKSFNKDIKAH